MRYSFNKLGKSFTAVNFASISNPDVKEKSNKENKSSTKSESDVGFAEEKPKSIIIEKFYYELISDYDEKEIGQKLDLNGEARHLNIYLKDNKIHVEVSKESNVLGLKMKMRSVLDSCGLEYNENEEGTATISESDAVNSVYLRDTDKLKDFIDNCKNWGSAWFNSKSKIKKDAAQQISNLITSLTELIK